MNTAQIINPIDQTRALVERDSYGFINTREVLNVFEANGWCPVSTNYAKVRDLHRQGFQKHLIRLENPKYQSIEGLTGNNSSRPQLVLLNSHDGTSSLQILWGVFRIACLNGIIAGTGINGVRLVHSKSIADKLPDAIQYMLSNFDAFSEQIKRLQGIQLSQDAVNELVKTTYDARLANVRNVKSVEYRVPRLLRMADNATDAYTVFNRIQEVLMRGGIQYSYDKPILDATTGEVLGTQHITTKTRRVASVASQLKLNQLVYDTTVKLAA
jgi:hypothetical protein